jgi:ATP-dependent DNA helicase DinG
MSETTTPNAAEEALASVDAPKDPTRFLEDVFGDGGVFANTFPGYRKRAGQFSMTTAVYAAINADQPVIIEAATGVGKSFAYLIPAIRAVTDDAMKIKLAERRTPTKEDAPVYHFSKQTHDESPRVLVVTAGLNLQDQLVNKDLPFLRKILPWPFRHQAAKGRSNYACLHRYHTTNIFEIKPEDDDEWAGIDRWMKKTQTGDLAELPFEVRPSLRPRISVSADECHGSDCGHFRNCHAVKARDRAGTSEVVVANFHLLLSHLRVSKAGEGTSILPRYDILILDECHELPNIARSFLGFHIHPGLFKELLKLLPAKNPLRHEVEAEIDAFFGTVGAYKRSGNYKARLKDPGLLPHEPICAALVKFAERLQDNAKKLDKKSDDEEVQEDDKREQNELRKAAGRIKEYASNIEQACLLDEPDRTVYFINEERFGTHDRYSLCGEPIDPAPLLRAMIWKAQEPKTPEEKKLHLPIAIGTSATLSTEDDGTEKAIGFMSSRIGADDAKRLVVRTPFNISKQVLTVYPDESPDPKSPDYAKYLAPLIVRAIRMARGRTLGLFTSKKALETVTALVRQSIGGEYPILKQGEAPRVKLVEKFRKDIPSCLFGVKSFWAGVDVPGEALSLVFIDKIPFDPPDDPVLDALSSKDKETFKRYSIPRAAIDLRQAFGRLIRSETDRGVVVLFDRRFMSTGWGKMLVKAMPSTAVTSRLDDIGKFFATTATT